MSKHTPGPWMICIDPPNPQWFAGSTIGNGHFRICDVSQLGPTQGEVHDANARLIAAAPEMLELLKAILLQKGFACECGISEETFDQIEAVITKATGEQS